MGASRAAGGLAAAVLLATSACAATRHSVARYRDSPAAAASVEAEAASRCRDPGPGAAPPPRRFATDGCSLWPDGVWQDCCVEHDMAYWCGGTRAQRRAADEQLRACVAAAHSGWMGALMRLGTRVGAPPWIPARWRWGYGYPYPAGYREDPACRDGPPPP